MVRNEWFAFLLGPAVLQIEFLNVESFPSQLIWHSVVGLHLLQDSDGHVMDLAANLVEVVHIHVYIICA